jgi:dTMP kinase
MHRSDTDSTVKNFIVLEGIDGSGTTTQLRRLSSLLERRGIPVMATAEPTSRPEGALIRRILKGELEADAGTVAYLFAADRHQHLYGAGGVIAAAEDGKIVLCDRYSLSSLAYQGMTCGPELPGRLNGAFPAPGLTLFFRLAPEVAMARVQARDQLEIYEKLHIQKLVSAAYDDVVAEARGKGWNIVTIDAENPLAEVGALVDAALEEYLQRISMASP